MQEAYLFSGIVGGLVASLTTTIVSYILQNHYEKKKYIRTKKEEVYNGLLEAYSSTIKNSDDRAKIDFLHNHFRVQLFGSPDVAKKVDELYYTLDREQIKSREELIGLMRKDLGVDPK